ncbi:MFS transporter [Kosmotoga pacifica]|uniref:MFS transporter n=1 Tax=Kosmotoga pacifica TaxID=1330330 RepID=A0A0G2Z9Y1_9BACT|nr:MFS transporter [Kosmotoga pacifica]AKI96901.1 hypothetical protein IX53_02655 [Kosmotoga pacifica]
MRKGSFFNIFNYLISLFSAAGYLLFSSINTIAADWGLSYSTIGKINFAGYIFYTLIALFLGSLGDRYGYKKILYPSMFAFSLVTISGLLVYSSHSVLFLYLFAILVYSYFGLFYPLVEGLLSRAEKLEGIEPSLTTTRFTLSWSSGNMLGMAFGPYLIQKTPSAVFLIVTAISLFGGTIVLRHYRSFGERLPFNVHKSLLQKPKAIDFPKINLYRKTYRLSLVLTAMLFSSVISLFPKLMAMSDISLENAGFLVVAGNVAVFLTFILMGKFRFWVGNPGISMVLIMLFPLSIPLYFLKTSVLTFFLVALFTGINYSIPYTFAIFYGLNSPNEDHGKQGGLHETMIGLSFGFGPLLSGYFLEFWPGLYGMGILAIILATVSVINQLAFLKRVKKYV